MQINKDNIHKNGIIIYYNYKFGDKVITNNKFEYEYKKYIRDYLRYHTRVPMALPRYKWVQRQLDITDVSLIPIILRLTFTMSIHN